MQKKAIIFGVSGQDGAYLSKLLLEKGYSVVGTSRDAQKTPLHNLLALNIKDDIVLESASLNDFRSVLQVIANNNPDEIYNLAGQSSVGLSFAMPVETFESISIANLNLLEVIRFLDKPVRYYNAGSSECFGNTFGEPVDETMPFRPRSPYAVAKSAAHWQVANYREAYDIFACNGILFNHESILRPNRFVTRKIINTVCRIASGSNEKLFLGNIEIKRDWGWAPEYVDAMWRMLQQETPEDFIVATGETNSLENFVVVAFSHFGLDWREHTRNNKELLRPTDIEYIAANPKKAEEKLQWKAQYKMKDVVRMMIEAELARDKHCDF